jgi:hypothetical protein
MRVREPASKESLQAFPWLKNTPSLFRGAPSGGNYTEISIQENTPIYKRVRFDAGQGTCIKCFCIVYQLDIVRRIDAPQSEIDYLSTLDGTHCDVDNDEDCDWDDYQNRNW